MASGMATSGVAASAALLDGEPLAGDNCLSRWQYLWRMTASISVWKENRNEDGLIAGEGVAAKQQQ